MASNGSISQSFGQKKSINTTISLMKREYDDISMNKYGTDIIRGRFNCAKSLYRKDLYAHFGCVNAIEFSDNGQWMVSGGDDRRVLLWNVEKAISNVGIASVMKGEHNSNIFCLGFDSHCNRLFSAGNDELVMIHDAQTCETVDVILHTDAIYGISVDPIDDNIIATACDDGRVCIWDVRGPSREPFILARCNNAFHAVVYNPLESRLIATANAKEGVALWDIRKPRCVMQQFNSSLLSSQSAMSVRFNKQGTLILALRRRLPPVLYNLTSPYPIVEFDNCGYYNSCTMKSCSFGGDSDQYVLSGSDDFKLYMWKIPDHVYHNDLRTSESTIWIDQADLVLKGHRSIVNQVRYNYSNSIIASSGVEKVIKFWSSFPLPYGTGGLEINASKPKDNRKVFSHEDYINLVLESGQFVTHDYSHQSVTEDPRMMAFFDSLVQRDIEGWTSDSSDDSIGCSSSFYELCWNTALHSDESNSDSNAPNSNIDTSDHEEMQTLNSHIVSCIDVLTKRIQANKSQENGIPEKNGCPPDDHLPSSNSTNIRERFISQISHVSGRKTQSQDLTTTPKGSNPTESESVTNEESKSEEPIPSQSASESVTNQEIASNESNDVNDVNRISKLIADKKRDQLRKIAKMTVRTAKKRLKRIQRSSVKGQTSNTNNCNDDKVEVIQKKLDFLSQQVECDSLANDGNKNERNSSRRIHKRLRFLTNQSDLVFNEVLPVVSSSSSDSESSNFVSGDELYDVLTNEVERMRHLLPNDSDADNSSDSDNGFQNLILNSNVNQTNDVTSSQSDDNNEISHANESTNGDDNKMRDKHQNSNKPIQLSLLNYSDSSESSDDASLNDNNKSHVHDKVIHCPYKHNLCPASTSSSTQGNDAIKKSVMFKPIDTRRRTYRKRKRNGSECDKLNTQKDNNDMKKNE